MNKVYIGSGHNSFSLAIAERMLASLRKTDVFLITVFPRIGQGWKGGVGVGGGRVALIRRRAY